MKSKGRIKDKKGKKRKVDWWVLTPNTQSTPVLMITQGYYLAAKSM